MTDTLKALSPQKQAHLAVPVITCSWCGKPVAPNAPRMRLHESESTRVSGKWLAHFHPECGDALLDLCETNAAVLSKVARPLPDSVNPVGVLSEDGT